MADGSHYYNEFNADAAQWLQNLMDAGHIPRGDIDTRSIEDVTPNDVAHYTQCHWFAGIGGWPLALRLAGWPDSRPIWTGSCPCQPFSAAGKGAGFADERHLWPAWLHLIRQRRPATILGEQVASPDALRWFDLVSADLEGSHYASGAVDLCSPGTSMAYCETPEGAAILNWIERAAYACADPELAERIRDFASWFSREIGAGGYHIRQRLYWTAYADERPRGQGRADAGRRDTGSDAQSWAGSGGGGEFGGLANAKECGRRQRRDGVQGHDNRAQQLGGCGMSGRVAHANGGHASTERQQRGGQQRQQPQDDGVAGGLVNRDGAGLQPRQSAVATAGHGRATESASADVVWLPCIDNKSRPASSEPGAFPLAHAIPKRLGSVFPELAGMGRSAGRNRRIRLHGYGNAIDPRLAAEFVRVVMDITAPSAQRRAG